MRYPIAGCLLIASLLTLEATPNPTDPLDPIYLPNIDMNPAHYLANVWVTHALAKVHTDAMPGTDHWARLAAARNEFESFQVHVRADSRPIAMTVTVSDFVNANARLYPPGIPPGSRTASALADSHRIFAATNVFVHREAYLDIDHVSDLNGTPGVTPDPLIPDEDPYFHQIRNAFPETVPAGEVRSAWIDVLTPDNAPSGYYVATVTVTDAGVTLAKLPVLLKIWDFGIPPTASLATAFGMSWNGLCAQAYQSYFNCGQFPGGGGSPDRGVERTHVLEGEFFLDHRTTISQIVYAGPTNNDWTHFDSTYGPLMDGSAGTLLRGAKLTNLQYTYGGAPTRPDIQDWVAHFLAKGWDSRLFEYNCDEPPAGCSWGQSLSEADFIHQASPGMATLLTTNIAHATAHGLLDAIDILTPVVDGVHPQGGVSLRPEYDAWLARPNKRLWWYQSCDQHESCANGNPGPADSTWPSYMVDASPVRNRIFQWMAFLYKIQGELYYQVDYCWTATDCASPDPWVSIYAFGGNGDGTLFYPGTPDRIGGSAPIPVSSIRLKLIRDGMEDYEYLAALAKSGDATFAEATARSFITNAYTFDNDPEALLAAREKLGARLHQRVHPAR
jgi:hypothetical protein